MDNGGIWLGGGLLLLGLGIGLGLGVTRGCAPKTQWGGPPVPQRTSNQAAKVVLSPEGEVITIKQKSSEWLPGGKAKLHLDDITGRQVLASITDGEETVVWGPVSLRAGDKKDITVGGETLVIEVIRLKNMLTGGDFGEFRVKRTP